MEGTTAKRETEAADGGVILGQGAIDAVEKALRNVGAICAECDRPCHFERFIGPSMTLEFLLATAKFEGEKAKVVVQRGYACMRRDCAGEEKFSRHPDVVAVRRIPSWEIIPLEPKAEEK